MSRAPVLCGDEISTGLDAASTYDMIQVILYNGRSTKQTRIFSLLQPSPETVSLFDDVIVLAEGQIIYSGPIEEVEDYFANIGFKSPEFTDVADFLQMVSTDDGANLYDPDESVKINRPNAPNASELAEIFRQSDLGLAIMDDLLSPLPYVWSEAEGGSQHGAEISNLVMSDAVRKKYANRFPRSTELVIWRFLVLWIRDKRVIIAGIVKNVLMGVSVGGVFWNTTDELSIEGALFQAGLFIMLGKLCVRGLWTYLVAFSSNICFTAYHYFGQQVLCKVHRDFSKTELFSISTQILTSIQPGHSFSGEQLRRCRRSVRWIKLVII